MAGFGDKPFGIREIKVAPLPSGTGVSFPVAQRMMFRERLTSGEMRGNDATVSVVAITDALEWELDKGGISLEALAVMTGRTLATSGTTPNQTITMTAEVGDNYPYFKLMGKSVGDVSTDDIHVIVFKAKLTGAWEGEFADGQFFITKMSGIAVDDGTNGIYDVVQNETAAALP